MLEEAKKRQPGSTVAADCKVKEHMASGFVRIFAGIPKDCMVADEDKMQEGDMFSKDAGTKGKSGQNIQWCLNDQKPPWV